MTTDLIDRWEAGDVPDLVALHGVCADLGEVESEIAPLAEQRERLRDAAARIVARLDGQKARLPGFGDLAITGGGESVSYDAKAVADVMADMLATGDVELMRFAARLAQAKRVTVRASSLRVTREKGAKK